MRRCCPLSFFGTRPRGEMTVLAKGMVEKGPATRRFAASFRILDRTTWGLRRTDLWLVYPVDAGLWSMVDGIRKPSRNPRRRKSAEWKPASSGVKTCRLIGVGSRKVVLLGSRALVGSALGPGVPSFAAGQAIVVVGALGVGAAFVRVVAVADAAIPGATAGWKGLTGSRGGDLEVVLDFEKEVHSEDIPRYGLGGPLHTEMAVVL